MRTGCFQSVRFLFTRIKYYHYFVKYSWFIVYVKPTFALESKEHKI